MSVLKKSSFRFISLLLASLMSLSLLSTMVSADSDLENNKIAPEEATVVAESFIAAAQGMDNVWTTETQVSESFDLCDEEGILSAYSIKLETAGQSSGYIVGSAYLDSPNIILEYSDVATPIHDEMGLESDEVVYTGSLGYYEVVGDGKFEDAYGSTVEASEINNSIQDARDEKYLEDNETIVEAALDVEIAFAAADSDDTENYDGAIISNPQSYAQAKYGDGPFVCYEWKNNYENYVKFRVTSSYPYSNHCGPTAITNLIEMIGNYKNIGNITKYAHTGIFNKVIALGIANGYYTSANGSYDSTLNTYIKQSFAQFGVNVTVSSTTLTISNVYSNIKTQINANRPFYLSLQNHSSYGNHGVAAYAYTRFIAQASGNYKSFVKIADGRYTSGRYIDMYDLTTQTSIMRKITVN